jgi:hypothetical protein
MNGGRAAKGEQAVRSLSRRGFLGGAAGVAAAAALPSGTARAAAAMLRSGSAQAATTPLVGATISASAYGTTNYVDAANIFDGFVGLPLATTIEKIYLALSAFPAKPPANMTQLGKVGCQFLVSVKPSTTLSSTEQSRLANFLAMLNSHGLSYRVALFAECNDKGFTVSEWLAYWSYYAPVVKDAGVKCTYNAGCNPNSFLRALSYFPSNPAPDELWMDYYGVNFRGGTRIDPLIAMAQSSGVPMGIGEWGWSAGAVEFAPMVMPWWNAFGNYMIGLANAGKFSLGAIFFEALGPRGNGSGVIHNANDPRIPVIQNVSNAIQAAS